MQEETIGGGEQGWRIFQKGEIMGLPGAYTVFQIILLIHVLKEFFIFK